MQKLPARLTLLLKVFTSTALLMTLYEASKEFIYQETLTPWESHSLTILVTATIAMATAALMRARLTAIHLREQESLAKQHSLKAQGLLLGAANHIVNNAFNYLQLINAEVDADGRVSADTLKLLQDSMAEAAQQMSILNAVVEPNDPKSYIGIFPV
ncbi:hypothetical protein [Reinekea sp.]|jgi:hypothetical protein|uniref:hypothetical protein n=1 Tax=Reinekea sp. TaxID=1970455 RepID=UPI002A8417DC|nr:hypothetical protein [Reinekea sp.]